MTTAERNSLVRAQMQLFRTALPELMPRYGGQWIVFADGKVVSAHDDEEQAIAFAMQTPEAPMVVAEVAEERPILLSARLALRW